MVPIYEKLFNLIISSGKIPNIWLEGSIMPVYKNKGAKNNTLNYRPNTILSCIGSLFTSIRNERLFSDECGILYKILLKFY